MIESISPDTLATTVRLLRDVYVGAILIVEGPDDAKCYSAFTVEVECEVVCALNRELLIAALTILYQANVEGILGIVDADFSLIDHDMPSLPSLFHTDTHDLETMIIASPALDRILAELGSSDKLRNHAIRTQMNHRQAIVSTALPIGYLRHFSRSANLNLRFEGIHFNNFILDKPNLSCNIDHLVSEVKNHSQRHDLKNQYLLQELTLQANAGYDPWQVCCGHDMTNILAIALRRLLGTNTAAFVASERIEQSLRLAYEFDYFRGTRLYANIYAWQLSTGYTVFKTPGT